MVKKEKISKTLLLDKKAIILALILGVLLAFLDIYFLILMLVFLFLGVIVTKHGYNEKKEMGVYEHERGWENVLANGLVPLIGGAFFNPGAFIGALAAVMADKFASELGILEKSDPINLKNLKRTKKGTNGAISLFGTWMSFIGALLIGVVALFLYPEYNLWKVLLIGVIGFIGSFVDSVFGVFEEKGIGTKATTNIICAIFGLILGYLFI
ncbi:MAG: DUF92 domain-containing protein [Candidatus Micrarchaeia archaeon]|jgi:uncharacterized protein (TIGR00297 family)